MSSVAVSEYRKNLLKYHKMILDNHEPLKIRVGKQGEVIVIPEEDFENMKETIYILKDKVTMESLLATRMEMAQGTFIHA